MVDGTILTVADALDMLENNLAKVITSISNKSDWITKPPKWTKNNDPLIHVKVPSTIRLWKALVNLGKIETNGGGKIFSKLNNFPNLCTRIPHFHGHH